MENKNLNEKIKYGYKKMDYKELRKSANDATTILQELISIND